MKAEGRVYCVLSAMSRAVLRDNTTAVVELVNIVGTSSVTDIHVSAVLVFSNLLQDVDTVQVPVSGYSCWTLFSELFDASADLG